MSAHDLLEIARLALVIALVVAAAALATPRGRVPLALRGVMKILRRDAGGAAAGEVAAAVPARKRLAAAVLVLAAIVLSLVTV